MKSLKFPLLIALLSLGALAQAASLGIHAAASAGDVAALIKCFADDPQTISSRDGAGRTPLCAAAKRGQMGAVTFLITQGADVNDKGFQAMTPLAEMACPWGLRNDKKAAEIAKYLISHGAAIDPVDVYGETPLLWAAEAGKPQLVEALLDAGADIKARLRTPNGKGPTALHLAVENRRKDVVEVLLRFNPPLDAVDYSGFTPLNLAEGETADMLRRAAGLPVENRLPQPSKEEMRAIAQRIVAGDNPAFDELARVTETMYQGIDYQKDHGRVMANLFRMKAAFDLLGKEAGKGNAAAFEALKKSLANKHLEAFVPDALGIAGAGGNKEAMDMLAHYEQWGILESSALFAFAEPVKAGVDPAIDFTAAWLSRVESRRDSGMVMTLTNALASAASQGNQKAQDVLNQFRIAAAGDVRGR